jgi:uncharacterized protein YegP (UPF0339 family)
MIIQQMRAFNKQTYFVIKSNNGKVLAVSETYSAPNKCRQAMNVVKTGFYTKPAICKFLKK